ALMNNGKAEQVGTAQELYRNPANAFVKDFLGTANFVQGRVKALGGAQVTVATPQGDMLCTFEGQVLAVGQTVTCVIRPQDVIVLTTLLTLPLAHVFTRYNFRGKGALGALLLVPMIMPPFVGAIGMRQFFARYGSVNLLLGMHIDWLGEGGFWGVVVLQTLNL